MSYATLLLHRSDEECTIVQLGDEIVALRRDEAQQYFERDNSSLRDKNSQLVESAMAARAEFMQTVTVRQKAIYHDKGRPPPPARHEVKIGDEVVVMDAQESEAYIDRILSSKFPLPEPLTGDFMTWWNTASEELKLWKGEFVTAEGSTEVDVPPAQRLGLHFPIGVAMAQLDHLQAAGWKYLHMSEDRRVDEEQETAEEAFVVRARYLMIRA